MKAAIIANPASGKDIRRIVAHGSVFDNQEKVRMVRRILVGLAAAGVRDVLYMPEGYGIVPRALSDLEALETPVNVTPVDIYLHNTQEDTVNAAALMQQQGVAVIIVMGGDGTSRAACKGARKTPILPLSTGTNNVFPVMAEATVAGLAAGVLACGGVTQDEGCREVCLLEVHVDGQFRDIALVDVAVYDDLFLGSRAIWDITKVSQIVVSRCRPDSIGLSTVAGQLLSISPRSLAAWPLILIQILPAVCAPPSVPACLLTWVFPACVSFCRAMMCPWGLRPAYWHWTASARWRFGAGSAPAYGYQKTPCAWWMWPASWNTPGREDCFCVAHRSVTPISPRPAASLTPKPGACT